MQVRLTNAADESLARRGQLPGERVRAYEAEALVDTGAVSLVIPIYAAQQLGVMTTHRRSVAYADGRREQVDVTEPVMVRIDGRITPEEGLVLGDEVLVGQTVLEKLDMLVDSLKGRLVPNPAHPDGPVSNVKRILDPFSIRRNTGRSRQG